MRFVNPLFWAIDEAFGLHSEEVDGNYFGTGRCGVCGCAFREDNPLIRRRARG